MVGDYRSHMIEPRAPSNIVDTRCSIFFLSESGVALLGPLVELHHTGCEEAWDSK